MNKKIAFALLTLFAFSIGNLKAQVPANSAYKKDTQTRFSKDFLNSNFDTPNVISCFLSKAGIREMVGRGKYYALVDGSQCENESVGVQDTGSGQSVSTPVYLDMMAESYMENNSLKAKLWISFPDDYSPNTYQTFVAASIDQSEIDKPPYGKWRVDFCDTFSSAPSTCVLFGFIDLDGKRVASFDKNADNSWAQRGIAELGSRENANGVGKFELIERGTPLSAKFQSGESFYRAQFSGSRTADVCYSPSVNSPTTRFAMWDTYLYDTQTGERSESFGGFRIKREASTSYEGYASYWGTNWWPSSGVDLDALPNGSRVIGEKGPNGQNQATTYELVKASGKLRKFSVTNKSLSEIAGKEFMAGINLNIIDPTSTLSIRLAAANAVNPSIRVKWNRSQNVFVISGFRDWTGSNERIVTFTEPISLAVSDLVSNLRTEYLSGWVLGSNSRMNIQLATPSWSGASYTRTPIAHNSIIVREESSQFVVPGEIASGTLYCSGNCLTPLNNTVNNPSRVSDAKSTNIYYWNGTAASLKYTNSSGADVEAGVGYYNSNKLVSTLSDLEKLGCDPSRLSDDEFICPWNDSTLTTWYQWESGENPWNKQQFLKVLGSDTFVNFSAPLQLTYQVPNTPNNGAYAGNEASIQYPGAGQLWVPGKCVDRLNLVESTCNSNTGWVHEFVIPTSETSVGKVTLADGSREYLVKWLNMGVYFAPFTIGGAEDLECKRTLPLTAADSMALPVDADFRNPASPDSPNYIGPWVEVSGSPAVIHGKLQ